MSAYNAFHVGGSSYIQCITWLVTDIEAMTEFKHSLKWYRLRQKNGGILRDSASLLIMDCDRALESPREIIYRSYLCSPSRVQLRY